MLLGGTVRSVEDVEVLMEMGLDFGEVSIRDVEEFRENLARYREVVKGSRFFYLCHGPQEGDPNNLHSLEHVYLPKLMEIIPFVNALGSKLLTIHLWMDSRFVTEEAIAYKVGFLRRLLELAINHNVDLHIENLSETSDDLSPVFEALPQLGLTMDVGHAQLLTRENRSLEFIRCFPERIRHVHIHDNLGGSSYKDDLHLPLGQGIIDFTAVFRALAAIGFQGTMTVELTTEQIAQCLDYVRNQLESSGLYQGRNKHEQ